MTPIESRDSEYGDSTEARLRTLSQPQFDLRVLDQYLEQQRMRYIDDHPYLYAFARRKPEPATSDQLSVLRIASSSEKKRRIIAAIAQSLGFIPLFDSPQFERYFQRDMRQRPDYPRYYPLDLAHAKYGHGEPHNPVIATDTVVIVNGILLEKPRSLDAAQAMLSMLSGNALTVSTGISLTFPTTSGRLLSFGTLITVAAFLKPITPDQVSLYLETEPASALESCGAIDFSSPTVQKFSDWSGTTAITSESTLIGDHTIAISARDMTKRTDYYIGAPVEPLVGIIKSISPIANTF